MENNFGLVGKKLGHSFSKKYFEQMKSDITESRNSLDNWLVQLELNPVSEKTTLAYSNMLNHISQVLTQIRNFEQSMNEYEESINIAKHNWISLTAR